MEQEHTNKKKLLIIATILVVLFAIGIIVFFLFHNNVSFEKNDKLFFEMFAKTFEEDEYEFYSLDAYYLEDTQMYYYNAKYKGYVEIEDTWYDVDEVVYGRIQNFFNMYCRSWDDLSGFEEEDKEFERAQAEGIHKTYTEEEINKLLEEAYEEVQLEQ